VFRSNGEANSFSGAIHSIFRIVVGFLFACHGASTLFGVFGGSASGAVALGQWPGWYAAVIELVGGVLVALGVGTRVAALLCSGSMAFAYFTVHVKNGLLPIENGGEPAALYAWLFVLIAAIGAGPWTLTNLLRRTSVESPLPAVAPAVTPQEA
jgi:putative oxidoreductase